MVEAHPRVTLFKPQGISVRRLEEVVLPVEGLEAMRLADLERMDHAVAADRMGVSRPTFSRVLTAARAIVAEALVQGLAIRIEGGDFMVGPPPFWGPGRGHGGWGRRGRGGPGGGRGHGGPGHTG